MFIFELSVKHIVILVLIGWNGRSQGEWITAGGLENELCQEDLEYFLKARYGDGPTNTTDQEHYYYPGDIAITNRFSQPEGSVNCFGFETLGNRLKWFFDMRPDNSRTVDTHFYVSSRSNSSRTPVRLGKDLNLTEVDFNPERKTVMIVHGFMSNSNASWVRDMAKAFLEMEDVNVIAVDWSGGGNTWKYWRAVANTRRVGCDITSFMKHLMKETGLSSKHVHCVGHSLGAHICSYASHKLGRFFRITGLDPAQPCFQTSEAYERLDPSDADFVDVIHTNGQLLTKVGFGLPNPLGHADFYPNGGVRQPGCAVSNSTSIWDKILPISFADIQQAICSHGRSYDLLTESLTNRGCEFKSNRWNLSYEGVLSSLQSGHCNETGDCAEMGIAATGGRRLPRAAGPYVLVTKDQAPFCSDESERHELLPKLLQDLKSEPIFAKKEKENVDLYLADDGSLSDFECKNLDKDSKSALLPHWLLTSLGVIYTYLI